MHWEGTTLKTNMRKSVLRRKAKEGDQNPFRTMQGQILLLPGHPRCLLTLPCTLECPVICRPRPIRKEHFALPLRLPPRSCGQKRGFSANRLSMYRGGWNCPGVSCRRQGTRQKGDPDYVFILFFFLIRVAWCFRKARGSSLKGEKKGKAVVVGLLDKYLFYNNIFI